MQANVARSGLSPMAEVALKKTIDRSSPTSLLIDPKLTGTVLGTAGSYQNDPNRTKEKAFDGSLSTFFDNCETGAWAGLDLSAAFVVSKIRYYARDPFPQRMVNGKFQASNSADFSTGVVDLFTVTTQPAIAWTEVLITNPNAYRYVRYLGPANSCSNVTEVEFYGAPLTSSDPKLSGVVVGTSGSYANDPNTVKEKVYDNSTSTFFDNCDNGAWSGLDLGSTYKVSKIRFYPRTAFPDRMVNGKFQASNSANFSSGVVDLFTIATQPAVTWVEVSITNLNGYRYLRYLGPSNGCANVAEVEFYGTVVNTSDPKLTGIVLGTSGSHANDPNTVKEKVYDNSTSTFFDNCNSGAWSGLDLGSTYRVSKIRFYPRSAFPDRMVSGKFQASNSSDFSSGVVDLYTITTQPPVAWNEITVSNTNGYRYVRYLGAANTCANVAEVEFYGSSAGGTDTTLPSTPTALSSSSIGQTSFTLTWAASTDNIGVTGYEIFRGGVSIATPTTNAYTVTGLLCNTSYAMQVRARDAAGNWSALSAALNVQTSSCGSSNDPKLNGVIIGTEGSLGNNPDVTREKVFDGNIDSFFDNCSADTWAGLDLGSTTYKITKVRYHARTGAVLFPDRMINGKFQGSNTANFSGTVTDLAQITARPIDGWNEIIISVPYGFRYVRYLSPGGSCGNVAEVEFYGSPAPIATDNTAPSIPTGFSASVVTTTSVTVSWNAATDNVGVTGYEVYRNGTALITINNTSFVIPGGCGSTYAIQVRAKDAVGNWSALSSVFNANTSACPSGGSETVGGGSDADPAVGPNASYNLATGYTLVKNWNWGMNGTIRNMNEMTSEFNYHDNFGTIGNGDNYGSKIIAADAGSALSGQRVEDPLNPVRQIMGESLRTYLLPFDNATVIKPDWHNVGDGSFGAKWELPKGGSLLGRDVVWETRMRYVVPQQYWWALWIVGDYWDRGAEIDLVEGFGYDNGCGAPCTNFDGRFWHSGSIDGPDKVNYNDWNAAMTSVGFPSFDPTAYHIWTLVYRQDNSYDMYCDGLRVQGGDVYWWTRGAVPNGIPIDMSFLFDGAWGHTQIPSVNKELSATTLVDKYYEYDYSRVYLGPIAVSNASGRSGSLETSSTSEVQLSVYPNPVNEILNVTLPEQASGNVEVKVFDITGKNLQMSVESDAKQKVISIDTKGLKKGTYVVRVRTGGKLYSQKFIK